MKDKLLSELRSAFERAAKGKAPAPDRKYHKHDEFISYGLKAAEFDRILGKFRPLFLSLSLLERLNLAEMLMAENIGELSHTGIYILSLSSRELDPSHFPFLDRVMDYFHSWSHADHICLGVLQPLLEIYREETFKFLEGLSHSPNRFKRRVSVVTFVRRAGKSGDYTDQVLKLCEHLAFDGEDIVRKGVGWALKDNLKAAPDRVIPFIKDLRKQGASSTITLYAIRGLKGIERESILAVKKN